MSFIGSLDQFDLSIILQKIEEYQKTGLLIVQQGETTIELSVQRGCLVCIGPVKPGVTLGERFAQAGIIPPEACYSIELALGERYQSENDAARAFLDASYVTAERLSQWAINEASQVLHAILTWEDGDLYFEENQLPPANRFQVPISIISLLPPIAPTTVIPPPLTPMATGTDISSPFSATPSVSAASLLTAFTVDSEPHTDKLTPASIAGAQQRVTDPLAPVHIDASFIQPNMTLVPADLSAQRESNPQVTLTPEQWRLFTRANGETTLSLAAHELHMTPDQVRRVACELHALGLVTILTPAATPAFMTPTAFDMSAGMDAYFGLQSADVASISVMAKRHGRPPIETLSQWGNGGNGATFQLGSGWVVSPTGPQRVRQQYPEQDYDRAFAQAS
ncbi:MAG TPA: DUF4388 domain-containing protein [Ktedonobacteraceae bacterium]|nr:DUF4388 domain-containing protein [Ktedonobacteraceae bacterium]